MLMTIKEMNAKAVAELTEVGFQAALPVIEELRSGKQSAGGQ